MTRFAQCRLIVLGAVQVVALASVGCLPDPGSHEQHGKATSKLLEPYKAIQSPASNTDDFVGALGGVPVDITGWRGYVAGTISDNNAAQNALFAIHMSGMKGDESVAGLTVAFVENGDPSGALDERIKNASELQVRFNNGTGIVSTHSFIDGTTVAAHKEDASSDTLLKRAFSDANALLSAAANQSSSTDDAKACLANYLATVSHAARCVNDQANTDECGLVRDAAVANAATCAGTSTANVLASADTSSIHTTSFNAGPLLFDMFFDLMNPGVYSTGYAPGGCAPGIYAPGAYSPGTYAPGTYLPSGSALTGSLGTYGGVGDYYSNDVFYQSFGSSTAFTPTAFGNPNGMSYILPSTLNGRVAGFDQSSFDRASDFGDFF